MAKVRVLLPGAASALTHGAENREIGISTRTPATVPRRLARRDFDPAYRPAGGPRGRRPSPARWSPIGSHPRSPIDDASCCRCPARGDLLGGYLPGIAPVFPPVGRDGRRARAARRRLDSPG